MVNSGIHEFVFSYLREDLNRWLKFWKVLGFEPEQAGGLEAEAAKRLYGHDSRLHSVRLVHPGCNSFQTGRVRLQFWERFRDEGLQDARPIIPGSRWMGLYTHDILQLRDSFSSHVSQQRWQAWMSPLVAAPLVKPPPAVDFFEPLVGLREQLVFCADFRLAFIQRAGFDRPGFGTFDDSLPYKNTEGSHANIVQPQGCHDTSFYKQVFGYETAPFGEAHDSGAEAPTIAALDLDAGETFRVERTRAVDVPSGLLQVYASYASHPDRRDHSRAGSRGLCLYSVASSDLEALETRITDHGGVLRSSPAADEFGQSCLYFDAPDGYSWLAVSHAG